MVSLDKQVYIENAHSPLIFNCNSSKHGFKSFIYFKEIIFELRTNQMVFFWKIEWYQATFSFCILQLMQSMQKIWYYNPLIIHLISCALHIEQLPPTFPRFSATIFPIMPSTAPSSFVIFGVALEWLHFELVHANSQLISGQITLSCECVGREENAKTI